MNDQLPDRTVLLIILATLLLVFFLANLVLMSYLHDLFIVSFGEIDIPLIMFMFSKEIE